jgi:hypothetical protein
MVLAIPQRRVGWETVMVMMLREGHRVRVRELVALHLVL